jgi:hypothetical protein
MLPETTHNYEPVQVDRIRVVKGSHDFERCLVDVSHREHALRWSQPHLDTFKSVIHNNDTLVSEETELICRWFDAVFSEFATGFTSFFPNQISQLGGDGAHTICVWSQVGLFFPLVVPDFHALVSRDEGLRDSCCVLAWRPQKFRKVHER